VTFVRYLTIQVLAYLLDMGLFGAALYLGLWGPIPSNVLGKIVAGIFAFLAHQRFTFRISKSKRDGKQAVRYFLLLGLNVPLSSLVLSLLLLIIDLPVAAKFLSDVVCVIFNFILSKKWIFPENSCQETMSGPERNEL